MKTYKIGVLILFMLLPVTMVAQRNLGDFSFGSLVQVQSDYTAKKGKIFVLNFKVANPPDSIAFKSVNVKFDSPNSFQTQKVSIQKIDKNTFFLIEVLRTEKTSKPSNIPISAMLQITTVDNKTQTQSIGSHQIPFQFTVQNR
jgi:hypothetical protein